MIEKKKIQHSNSYPIWLLQIFEYIILNQKYITFLHSFHEQWKHGCKTKYYKKQQQQQKKNRNVFENVKINKSAGKVLWNFANGYLMNDAIWECFNLI